MSIDTAELVVESSGRMCLKGFFPLCLFYMCEGVGEVHACYATHTSEDNLWAQVLSFHYIVPGIELRSAGLATSAISPTSLFFINKNYLLLLSVDSCLHMFQSRLTKYLSVFGLFGYQTITSISQVNCTFVIGHTLQSRTYICGLLEQF